MHVQAGWYPDPMMPGVLRYWTGEAWTQSTAPNPYAQQVPPAAYTYAPSTTQEPWDNPYTAASAGQPNRRATVVALAVIAAVVLAVVGVELSHYMSLRHDAATSSDIPVTVPLAQPPTEQPGSGLPASIDGLTRDPQSDGMAHHLTTEAELELSAHGSSISIGYYDTTAGNPKVFTETINVTTDMNGGDSADKLFTLETGLNNALGVRDGLNSGVVWTKEGLGDNRTTMWCEVVTQQQTPIRACAFVRSTVAGVIGEYDPGTGDGALLDGVRRAITGS